MWSDTFMAVEHAGWMRLLAWGIASFAVGVLLFVMALRATRSTLVLYFALQLVAWGCALAASGGFALRTLAERDYAGAEAVAHTVRALLWLGVVVGVAGTGLGARGVLQKRGDALTGTGAALCVEGIALALLQLVFLRAISGATTL